MLDKLTSPSEIQSDDGSGNDNDGRGDMGEQDGIIDSSHATVATEGSHAGSPIVIDEITGKKYSGEKKEGQASDMPKSEAVLI